MSRSCRVIQLIYSVVLLVGSTSCILTSIPTDIYTVRGSTVVLPCSTNFDVPVLWMYDKSGEEGYRKFLFQESLGPRYSISTDPTFNQYNLTITDVQLEDAGTYRCVDDEGYGYDLYLDGIPNNVATAELSVIDDRLRCWSSATGQSLTVEKFESECPPGGVINMHCNVTYGGSVVPEIKWSVMKNNSDNTSVSLEQFTRNRVTALGEGESQMSSEIIVSVTRWLNESFVNCRVSKFGDATSQENEPAVIKKLSWTSEMILIKEIDKKRLYRLRGKSTSVIMQNVAVIGITVVNTEIFVIQDGVSGVKIFDSPSLIETGYTNFKNVMVTPIGMVGSANRSAFYVADSNRSRNCVHRINLSDKSVDRWNLTWNYWAWGVSMTPTETILVTVQVATGTDPHSFASRAVEYTSEGQKLREIIFDLSIKYAYQTVQLSENKFVVSHGSGSSLHRICLISNEGAILKSFGSEAGDGDGYLNKPISLAVDTRSKHIFVADENNNRVLMFDTDLTYEGKVSVGQTQKDMVAPHRLHFDVSKNRLFLAEKSGRLLVINY